MVRRRTWIEWKWIRYCIVRWILCVHWLQYVCYVIMVYGTAWHVTYRSEWNMTQWSINHRSSIWKLYHRPQAHTVSLSQRVGPHRYSLAFWTVMKPEHTVGYRQQASTNTTGLQHRACFSLAFAHSKYNYKRIRNKPIKFWRTLLILKLVNNRRYK